MKVLLQAAALLAAASMASAASVRTFIIVVFVAHRSANSPLICLVRSLVLFSLADVLRVEVGGCF
jgi:hypothetical protein